jgi:hypothetical protein
MGRLIFALFLLVSEVLAQANVWAVPIVTSDQPPLQYFVPGEINIKCTSLGINQNEEKDWTKFCDRVIGDIMGGWEEPDHKTLKELAWVAAVFPADNGEYLIDFWNANVVGAKLGIVNFALWHYSAMGKVDLENPELATQEIYKHFDFAYQDTVSKVKSTKGQQPTKKPAAKPASPQIPNKKTPSLPVSAHKSRLDRQPPFGDGWRYFLYSHITYL